MTHTQQKTVPYDAWLHWVITDRCVMNCEYCRTGGGQDRVRRTAPVRSIDIPNALKSLEKTGYVCKISFTGGGEPFLVPNAMEASLEFTKYHYMSIYTNLSENPVTEWIEKIDPARITQLTASCHLKALERRHLLDRFIQNCRLAQQKGLPLLVAEVAYPPLLPEVERYRELFKKYGIDLKFGPFDGIYQGKVYPQSYTDEELRVFGLPDYILTICQPQQRQEIPFCNAGYNAGIVRPNGDITPCDEIQTSLGNIYTGIHFNKHIQVCPFEYCGCQIYHQDRDLFEQAKREDLWYIRRVVWKNRIRNQTFWKSLICR